MNLNPHVQDSVNAIQPESNGDLFSVTFIRLKGDEAEAALRPQVSTDAQAWTYDAINQEVIEDLGDAVRVRASIAREGNRTMFFRLRVQ